MITATFFTNFALGFILAAEFGQTSIEVFRRGLRFGTKQALLVSAGGAFADFVYLNIAIAGILFFLNRPEILKILWGVGGLTMVYIAINGIKSARTEKNASEQYDRVHPFVAGFLLNFAHPVNLIYWVTMLGSIIIKDTQETSFLVAYLNGLGIPLGVFAWWLTLSIITSYVGRWITQRTMRYISIGSSILLLGFASWFFYNAIIG